MCASQNLGPYKADVRRFWEAASCGEIYAEGSSAQEKFRQHAEARYRLEPYIRDFARFEEGCGQDILEIGIGMGADHVEWARSGPRHLAGIDLTPRAVAWTAQRLETYGFASDLCKRRTPRIFPSVIIHSVLYTHGECFITHPIRNGLSRKPIGCSGRAALSASWSITDHL